jgi:hypothetical protein
MCFSDRVEENVIIFLLPFSLNEFGRLCLFWEEQITLDDNIFSSDVKSEVGRLH